MSTRTRRTLILAVALVSAIGIVVLGVRFATHRSDRAPLPFGLEARAAAAPLAGFQETRVAFDGRCRPVAVAATPAQREEGLRGHDELGRYAGMLFVFDGETDAAFTMSGVTDALEIGWYSANGMNVGSAHMAPCPARDEADCPLYEAGRPYRVALELPGGSDAPGQLAPCS